MTARLGYQISENFSIEGQGSLGVIDDDIEGFDVGVEYSNTGGLTAELVYFDQTIEDEIIFDGAQFQGFLQVSGETESKGVELSVEQRYTNGINIKANYTYNDSETSDGQDRLRRPKHLANAVVIYPLSDKWQVSGNARLSKDAVDIGNVALSNYVIFGLNASYQVTNTTQKF